MSLFGIITILCLFVLKYLSSINTYVLMIMIGILFTLYSIIMTKLICNSNHIIENIAIKCNEDGDHVRNLS